MKVVLRELAYGGLMVDRRVVFLTYVTLADYDYKKYGKEVFERYFEFEVWNLHDYFLGENVVMHSGNCSIKGIKSIKSVGEFVHCLKQYNRKKTFLFCLFPSMSRKTYYLETVASIMGFKYSMIFGQPYLSRQNVGKLRDDLSHRKKDYVNMVLSLFFPPVFNFVAAHASVREFPSALSIKKQNNIMIHTLDYDVYLDIKDETKKIGRNRYIVFVDENYVDHDDYQIFGVKPPFRKSEDYYAPMRKMFDAVEELYGCQVIIAEHPRAHYPNSSIYGKREMVKGKTAQLIRDAELVLCHASTTLDYIIMFKKKYLLIYLDEIKKFYEWDAYYVPLLKYLKIRALNVSKDYNNEEIKEMISSGETVACQKYRQRFIKQKGTREEPFFEIVTEYINNYFEGIEKK